MMKQKYVKPVLKMELFSLTQNIAAPCGSFGGSTLGKPSFASSETCGWDMGNMVVWTDANNDCDFKWGENEPFNGVCLHNPNGGVQIFGS